MVKRVVVSWLNGENVQMSMNVIMDIIIEFVQTFAAGNVQMSMNVVIDIIIEIVQTLAAVFALGSVWIMRKQMKKEYDCRRREQTVQLVGRWSENLHPNINRIKRVAEKLSSDQCRKIYNEEEFHASKEIYREIVKALGLKENLQNTNGECTVSAELSSMMHYELVFYLNQLETVLISWQHHIADDEIIEAQFSFLLDDREGKTILENFRRASGSEKTYPAIEMFSQYLKKEREKSLNRKAEL